MEKREPHFFKNDEIMEISSLNKSFYCWFVCEENACAWSSKDGQFCSVSISVKSKDERECYREAKMITDIKKVYLR
jgi:hypothetical protein